MHGLETIRGSNQHIDSIARSFLSYISIDWTKLDHTNPTTIVSLYYRKYLPSKIIVSHGYHPTFEWPSYPELDIDMLYQRMSNLLTFDMNYMFNMIFITAEGYGYTRDSAKPEPSGRLPTQFYQSFTTLVINIDSLLHFGFTIDEIKSILMLIMGDDNTFLTLFQVIRLHNWLSFHTQYVKTRWHMEISIEKTLITTLRNKITTLQYQCNYGHPKRESDKIIAQAIYPEHGVRDKYMSSRMIGLAYASAGNDHDLYRFLYDLYKLFLPHAEFSPDTRETTLRSLFGPYLDEDMFNDITLDEFPSIEQIRSKYTYYLGPLSYYPKWPASHFRKPPDYAPENYVTMSQYAKTHGITPPMPTHYDFLSFPAT